MTTYCQLAVTHGNIKHLRACQARASKDSRSSPSEFNSRVARTVPIRATAYVNGASFSNPFAFVLNDGSTRNVALPTTMKKGSRYEQRDAGRSWSQASRSTNRAEVSCWIAPVAAA